MIKKLKNLMCPSSATILSVFILVPMFFVSGCANQNTDSFAKKEECNKYFYLIEEKAEADRAWGSPTEPIVFYSPNIDSSVGRYTVMKDNSNGEYFYMFDLLTNEHIYNDYEDTISMDGWNRYDAKIAELLQE